MSKWLCIVVHEKRYFLPWPERIDQPANNNKSGSLLLSAVETRILIYRTVLYIEEFI